MHAALARAPVGEDLKALAQAAKAWDEALESEAVRSWAHARAKGLPPSAGAEALDALRDEVVEELAGWVLAREVPIAALAPEDGVLEGVAWRVRGEVLERIETGAQALEDRVQERRALATHEEWLAFLSLQRQCQLARAVGGEDARRLACDVVQRPLCNFGAWLFNQREERAVANGMFRWLQEEAQAVGSEEELQLFQRNVHCGP